MAKIRKWYTYYQARVWLRIESELPAEKIRELIVETVLEIPWLLKNEPAPLQLQPDDISKEPGSNRELKKNEQVFVLLSENVAHRAFFAFDKYLYEIARELKRKLRLRGVNWRYSFESQPLWDYT